MPQYQIVQMAIDAILLLPSNSFRQRLSIAHNQRSSQWRRHFDLGQRQSIAVLSYPKRLSQLLTKPIGRAYSHFLLRRSSQSSPIDQNQP